MNIELKHILAYLPYDLKIKWNDTKIIMGITLEDQTDYNDMKYPLSTIAYCIENQNERELNFKLLLRPLKNIMTDGYETINKDGYLGVDYYGDSKVEGLEIYLSDGNHTTFLIEQQELYELLLSNHYDVFGLINNGFAEAV